MTNPFVDVPRHALVAGRLFVFLFYVGLIVGAVNSNVSASTTGVRLLAIAGYLFISCYPIMFRIRGVGILHPLYFLSAYGFLKGTLTDFGGLAFGVDSHPALPAVSRSEIAVLQVKVLLLQSLGWLMVYAGFRFTRGISWDFVQIRPKPKIMLWGAAAAYVVGTVAFALLARLSGGLMDHLKNTTRGFGSKVYVMDPEYASIYAFLVTLVMLAPALILLRRKSAPRSPVFWLLATFACALLFMVNGRRSALVRPVLLFVTCWIHKLKELPMARLMLLALALFCVVGPIGQFRRNNWSGGNDLNFDFVKELTVDEAFLSSLGEVEDRRSGGPLYPLLYRVPDSVDFKYGANYAAYIYRFIPRVIWKSKPRGIGVECGSVMYGVEYAVPPGTYGEAYWSGGVTGVIIVFFLWGMFLKSLHSFYLRFHHTTVGCLLYLMTLAILTPDETGFRSWIFLFAPSVAILTSCGILKFKKPSK